MHAINGVNLMRLIDFLEIHPELELKTIPWSRTPTAYLIKK